MRILLLVPPVVYMRQPGIGVAYLSSYLKSKGHETRIMDLNTEISGINDGDDGYWAQESNAMSFISENTGIFEKWISRILDYRPDIVGFNVWSTSKSQALYLANGIKKKIEDDKNPGSQTNTYATQDTRKHENC